MMPSPKINRAPNLGIISETSPEISNNLTSLASFEICKITQIFPKVKVLITKLVQLKKVVLKSVRIVDNQMKEISSVKITNVTINK